MKRLIIITFFKISLILGLNSRLFKKTVLDGADWQIYVNKTVPFSTFTIIECGSICTAQDHGGCDMYIQKDSTKNCYIGYFENTETTFLTDQSGPQNVYLNTSKHCYFHICTYYYISYFIYIRYTFCP